MGTHGVKNEEVLLAFAEDRNILRTIKRRKSNWIVHMLRRNCLLKHVIEGNIEGKGRRGRRGKQKPNGLDERRGYCNLKEEAINRTR